MRIGFDAKRLFCNESGLGSYSRNLIQDLLAFYPEIDIDLFTTCIKQREELKSIYKAPNIRIHSVSFGGALWRTFLIPLTRAGRNLDVYHGLSGELPLFSFRKKVKRVVTIHDVIFKSRPEGYKWIDRMLYNFKTQRAIKVADNIVSVSYDTKSQLGNYYDLDLSKVSVISPSISSVFWNKDNHLKVSEFNSFYNLRGGFWLYVGSFHKRKNLRTLFEAISLLPVRSRKKLVLISKDKWDVAMRLARYFNIEDNVRIESEITDRVLSLFYQNCKALIYPSMEEGFGMPILEGLAKGCTVVCSDIPSHREAGGGLCKYFSHNNPEELKQILTSLSKSKRNSHSQTLTHLNQFNPKKLSETIVRLYKN